MKKNLRNEIAKIIGIELSNPILNVEYKVLKSTQEDGYIRQLIEYDSYGDKVRAFLLLPKNQDVCLLFLVMMINIQKMLLI